MDEPIALCDHQCEWHPPVSDPDHVWIQVWRNREVDEMTEIRNRLDEMDDGEVRRTLAWLNDYFTEGVSDV